MHKIQKKIDWDIGNRNLKIEIANKKDWFVYIFRNKYYICNEEWNRRKTRKEIWDQIYWYCTSVPERIGRERLLAFWDKEDRAVVIVTCGFIKKSNKTPNSFIENAIKIKHKYYIEKSNANENL